MIRYLDPLYTTDKTAGKIDTVKRSFRLGSGAFGLYIITIASNTQDVFDIIPIPLFKQRALRHRDYDVIGVAESKEAAFLLVQRIYEEYYRVYNTYSGIRSELTDRLAGQERNK